VRYIFDAICPAGREGDLYHIATDRKGGYIAFERSLHGKPRKYIAFAKANISPKKRASVSTEAVLAKKRGRGALQLLVLFLSVGNVLY
jgi:hypothetical protein